jgi:CRISPR-associated protein Cas5 subtype I-B
MKALVIKISFSEAFFKVHYTKGFRLTYPMPLPTTVAGMIGALLGIERGKLKESLKEFVFGSKLIKYGSIIAESTTFIQFKSKGPETGVVPSSIVNEPEYLIVIGGEDKKIAGLRDRIQKSVKFYPYGGQNDFFAIDWKIEDIDETEESNIISNYAPQDWVENFLLEKNSEISILPVRHKFSNNPNFYFVVNGKLKLKKSVLSTSKEKIGLYSLTDFDYLE